MKTILVTGGAGFIGSNFIRYTLQTRADIAIINLDKLTYAGSLDNLKRLSDPSRHHFVKGDIQDRPLVEQLMQENRVDTIVHFAAESHVDRSIAGPDVFIETNVMGTLSLLESARNVWNDSLGGYRDGVRFHHISTDEVYGSLRPTEPAFKETTPYAPNSPYAASKASSDHLVRAYHATYELPATISNCSNNYGPYQFPEKLIPLVLIKAINGEALPIYGDGQQIRDWLYVRDHCQAIWRVLDDGIVGETYHIGGDNQWANLALVKHICSLLDQRFPYSKHVPHESLIEFITDRPGHDRRYAMDINKIRDELRWKPSESLESGLEKTIDWYLENTKWLAEITGDLEYKEWLIKNYVERKDLS